MELVRGLLARGVEHVGAAVGATGAGAACRPGDPCGDLQHERRLADAWLTPEQHQGAGNEAATQDAIDLGDADAQARRGSGRDLAQRTGCLGGAQPRGGAPTMAGA